MAKLNDSGKKILSRLQDSYISKQGYQFDNFYCPVLFKDEDTELCIAHIVNRSLPGVSKRCTIQRKDVDGFYGTNFEADFLDLEVARGKSAIEVINDKSLSRRLNATIWAGDEKIEHFPAHGPVPE